MYSAVFADFCHDLFFPVLGLVLVCLPGGKKIDDALQRQQYFANNTEHSQLSVGKPDPKLAKLMNNKNERKQAGYRWQVRFNISFFTITITVSSFRLVYFQIQKDKDPAIPIVTNYLSCDRVLGNGLLDPIESNYHTKMKKREIFAKDLSCTTEATELRINQNLRTDYVSASSGETENAIPLLSRLPIVSFNGGR